MVNLPHSSKLNIAPLAASFNNVTNSYKFYWFLAILESIKLSSNTIILVDALLASMIASVWYPLHYFHLSFGKQDRLGEFANKLKVQDSHLEANAIQADILDTARKHFSVNSFLSQEIRSIGNYVPQRFLRPFFQKELRGLQDWKINDSIEKLAESAFHENASPCLYRFVNLPNRRIEIQPVWFEYLQENLHILVGFCLWHLVNYIQKNNPNVPNISGKLFRPEQRDLKKARTFWRVVMGEVGEMRCIYTQEPIPRDGFSLDHFLPWSFVAHDLLWNLIPTPKSVNSSKGDQLPDISLYFEAFARSQFEAVRAVDCLKHAKLLEDYALLFKQNSMSELQSIPFENFRQILFDTITPQIQIARNMGFSANWNYQVL